MGLHALLLWADHQEIEQDEQRNEKQQGPKGLGQSRNAGRGTGGRLGKSRGGEHGLSGRQ